jgi:hypothetical protein
MTSIVRRATAGRLAIAAGIVLISMFAGLPAPTPAYAQCGLPGTPPCPPPKKPTKTPTRRPRTPTPTETTTPTPTETFTLTATAVPCDTNVLIATLNGNSEVPSVVTQGIGTVKLLLDVNAGTITGNWEIMLLWGSMTAAHIHNAPAGQNAGVFISFIGLPGGTGGSFATLNSAPVAKLQDVLNNPPAFYVNVHTMSYPGGEIRGQLACAPAGEPVASPTAMATATPAGGPTGGGGAFPIALIAGLIGLGGVSLGLGLFGLRKSSVPGGLRIGLIILGGLSLLSAIFLWLRSVGTVPSPVRPAVPTDVYITLLLVPMLGLGKPGAFVFGRPSRRRSGDVSKGFDVDRIAEDPALTGLGGEE